MRNIPQKEVFTVRICDKCQETKTISRYSHTNNPFYEDGVCPVCNDCLEAIIRGDDYNWATVDKICQYLDIPFVPRQWASIVENNKVNPFTVYAELFEKDTYKNLDWGMYYEEYKKLEELNLLKDELPGLSDEKIKELKEFWGPNYDEDELGYLENLYNGVLNTQSVNGGLQTDQAKKLCKISLEIESRIRAGQDFDKLLKSYESLVKIAEFTPKNAKNASDFDSVGKISLLTINFSNCGDTLRAFDTKCA